jgi:hypothetical protein
MNAALLFLFSCLGSKAEQDYSELNIPLSQQRIHLMMASYVETCSDDKEKTTREYSSTLHIEDKGGKGKKKQNPKSSSNYLFALV